MKRPERDSDRVEHAMEAIFKIEDYTVAMTRDNFMVNTLVQDAVFKNLEIIGEALKHVTKSTKNKFPEIAWRRLTELRNELSHEYFSVNASQVFAFIQKDMPTTKKQLETVLRILVSENTL